MWRNAEFRMKRLIVLFACCFLVFGCQQPTGGRAGGTDSGGEKAFVPVSAINGALPGSILAGSEVDLNGYVTVEPENATVRAIVWSADSPEAIGVPAADMADGVFTPAADAAGTVVAITATIPGGGAGRADFVSTAYAVTVIGGEDYVAVTGISGVPERRFMGVPLDLGVAVAEPADATYSHIVWSIENAGTTGAFIAGGTLTAPSSGTLTLRGTIDSPEEPYIQDFTVTVMPLPDIWTKAAGVPAQMPGEIQTVCYGVVNGQGLFVAGSRDNDGHIAWSDDDGVTWHGLDSATTTFQDPGDPVIEHFVHVRFLNGAFWAVGGGGHMAKSADGKTWTAVANPGITMNIVDIAYGEVEGYADGVFVAGGDDGRMSYSTDGGITWTTNDQIAFLQAGNSVADFKALTWANGKFLAVGQFAKAIYSADGIQWRGAEASEMIADLIGMSTVDWPLRSGWYGLSVAVYGNGLYATASQGVVLLSEDCEEWEAVDMEPFGFPRGHSFGWINSLIFADGLFILGGADGEAAYSADGRNWTPINTTKSIFHNFHFINGLACANGKLVAVGATCAADPCPNPPDSTSPGDHAGNAGCVALSG
jgi:hypothetical protein